MCDRNDEFKETSKQKAERELREYEAKNVQHYLVQATFWFTTKLEKDKSILAISSAAIGLLITIIITKNPQSIYQMAFFILAIVSFVTTIITVINVFEKNASQIEETINDRGHINEILHRYDLIVSISFYAGILFTILLGISYGASQYINKSGEKKVATENCKQTPKDTAFESYSNSDKLKATHPTSQGNKPKKEK